MHTTSVHRSIEAWFYREGSPFGEINTGSPELLYYNVLLSPRSGFISIPYPSYIWIANSSGFPHVGYITFIQSIYKTCWHDDVIEQGNSMILRRCIMYNVRLVFNAVFGG